VREIRRMNGFGSLYLDCPGECRTGRSGWVMLGPSVFGAGGAGICGRCQLRAGWAVAADLAVTGVCGRSQAGLLRTIAAIRPNAASRSA
jgi:hypothetical protein